MRRPKASQSARLLKARIALSNAQSDPVIGPLLSVYGYDAARLAEGVAVLQVADSAVQAQMSLSGHWQWATKALDTAEDEARAAYRALREVVRAAYGLNDPVQAVLGLNQPMPLRQSHFLAVAITLFNNALGDAEIAATLARFGYTGRRLATEKAKVDAMAAALETRESAKGGAQQATMDQRTALNDLGRWMSAFFRVARVALRGQEQLLEKLGLFARNERTEAQRHAAAKAAETRKARRDLLKVVPNKEEADQAAA